MTVALSDGTLRALGRVVVNFGVLEAYLEFGLGGMISGDQYVARAVTGSMPFRGKCETIKTLFRYGLTVAALRPEAECNREMDAWLDRAQKAVEERNRIIHSVWVGEESGTNTRIKFRPHKPDLVDVITESHINGLADELRALADELIPLLLRSLRQKTPPENPNPK